MIEDGAFSLTSVLEINNQARGTKIFPRDKSAHVLHIRRRITSKRRARQRSVAQVHIYFILQYKLCTHTYIINNTTRSLPTGREMMMIVGSSGSRIRNVERGRFSSHTRIDVECVTARVHARCRVYARGSRRIYFRRGRVQTHHPLVLSADYRSHTLKATHRYLYTVVYSPPGQRWNNGGRCLKVNESLFRVGILHAPRAMRHNPILGHICTRSVYLQHLVFTYSILYSILICLEKETSNFYTY